MKDEATTGHGGEPESAQGRTTADGASERSRRWAATTPGFAHPRSPAAGADLRTAHADSHARVELASVEREGGEGAAGRRRGRPDAGMTGPGLLARGDRESLEAALLAGGATAAAGGGTRAVEEEPDPYRTCFERDRDRILHSPAFRRLAGKTQVFVHPEDHQRTRLTHALEVAQVATSVARACRLNVALTEAIALGHDCGHGPGGHASEDALHPYLPEGFDHAPWGADVSLASLNLCAETLDGIRHHSWSLSAPSTPEGEVVSWADRIAYVCHDWEDAVATGIVSPGALPVIVRERCGERRSQQLGTFIEALVRTIHTSGAVAMEAELAEALATFRACNYETIYLREASVVQGRAVVAVLRALVEHFADRPNSIPAVAGAGGLRGGEAAAIRAAVTYVAGMTDRFASRQAVALLGWDPDKLPRGVDA